MSENYRPFEKFYIEMIDEMMRHEPEKGFGWLDYDNFTWWDGSLHNAIHEYLDSHDPTQLVDIANFCAMIWHNRTSNQTAKKVE